MTKGEWMLYGGIACIGLALILIVVLIISHKLRSKGSEKEQAKLQDETKAALSSLTVMSNVSNKELDGDETELVDLYTEDEKTIIL